MSADGGRGAARTAEPPAEAVGSEAGGVSPPGEVGPPSGSTRLQATPPASRYAEPCSTCRNAGTVAVRFGRETKHKLCPTCGGTSNPALMEEMATMNEERATKERERSAEDRRRLDLDRRRRTKERQAARRSRRRNRRAR